MSLLKLPWQGYTRLFQQGRRLSPDKHEEQGFLFHIFKIFIFLISKTLAYRMHVWYTPIAPNHIDPGFKNLKFNLLFFLNMYH